MIIDMVISTSQLTVKNAADRIQENLNSKNIPLFARINHAESARKVGLTLPDEELLIFGDPKVGTFLMQENPKIGIELPLKILIWSENNVTKIGYINIQDLAREYQITKNIDIIAKMDSLLKTLVQI